ncbi:MAG: helix-turn-helix domain-containing protein [Acetivibrio ethanolgignens]
MAKKKKVAAEFRIYELTQGEDVLALTGEKWVQIYGRDVDNLHFHNLLEIGLCHYGEGMLIIEDRQYRFSKNMLSFIPVNVLHTTESDIESVGFWEYLFLSPERIVEEMYHGKKNTQKELLELINRDGFFIRESDNPALSMLVRQIFDEVREKRPFYRESVKGLLYATLLEGARRNGLNAQKKKEENGAEKREGTKLNKAIVFVEENYARNFKISELAEKCYMSETHFRRFFQERMNMTPVEFVNFIRIKRACELIDNTDLDMEEIAERVGFVTPSTFNRNFRKIMETSPYQWKKRPDNHKGKLIDYKISALKGW